MGKNAELRATRLILAMLSGSTTSVLQSSEDVVAEAEVQVAAARAEAQVGVQGGKHRCDTRLRSLVR